MIPSGIQVFTAISNSITALEKLCPTLIVHKKKFEFAISQLRRFLDHFSTIPHPKTCTSTQTNAHYAFLDVTRELTSLISQYLDSSWANSVLENPSDSVANELFILVGRLKTQSHVLDPDGSSFFDPTSVDWHHFHILDLNAITVSLQQHLLQNASDSQVSNKLQSITEWLNNNPASEVDTSVAIFSPIPLNYHSWRLSHSDFTTENAIGSGGTAIVYFGRDNRTGEQVAVKCLRASKLDGLHLKIFQRELAMLASASHPTLVKFIGATDSPPFSIVTNWEGGGSLWDELHQRKALNRTQLAIVAIDVARGLRFLHSRQILHRDLKSLNVLLSEDGQARICDFGFSRKLTSGKRMTNQIGTSQWMAPELLIGNSAYDGAVDVYAYGILLWEIVTKLIPYGEMPMIEIIQEVVENDLRPVIPAGISVKLTKLMKNCWARNPEDRPTFAEIVKEFRNGIDFPEADSAAVGSYLREHSDRAEEIERLENALNRAVVLEQFVEVISGDIPEDFVDRCWTFVMTHKESPVVFARCVACFLKSSMAIQAATMLREMAPPEIPHDVAKMIVTMLPTGQETLNHEIVMIGCRCGLAVEVAKRVFRPEQLQIAFEVLVYTGVTREQDKEDITRRCSLTVLSNNSEVVAAALRCLIAIGETKKLSIEFVRGLTRARTLPVKMLGFLTIAKISEEGVELPDDMILLVIQNVNQVSIARTVVMMLCRKWETAKVVVKYSRVIEEKELWIRVMAVAAQHLEIIEDVREAIRMAVFPIKIASLNGQLLELKKRVQLPCDE
jgi:hypothetical protein